MHASHYLSPSVTITSMDGVYHMSNNYTGYMLLMSTTAVLIVFSDIQNVPGGMCQTSGGCSSN
jgi:hypothetical protein